MALRESNDAITKKPIFIIGFFFLLCILGTPQANYSMAFSEKVQQCHSAAV